MKAVEVVSNDPNNDGPLVSLTLQAMTDPRRLLKDQKGWSASTVSPCLPARWEALR